MPTELAHYLKETPQIVFVCQKHWHEASNDLFVVHVYICIHCCIYQYDYRNVYIYICIYMEKLMNRLAFGVQNSMKKVSVYKSLPEYSIC